MPHTLPELSYSLDALEPHIGADTMAIHHGKHHNAYVTNLNAAVEGTAHADSSLCELLGNISSLPADKQGAVRNNGGGHANHTLFWKVIAPGGASAPSGELAAAIDSAFGSFDAFKEAFAKAGATRFGSGWAWLITDSDGNVKVASTANQDNPCMGEAIAGCSGKGILALDVWEHAYYLNYQNRRPDYIGAFWNIVNWDVVSENYAAAQA